MVDTGLTPLVSAGTNGNDHEPVIKVSNSQLQSWQRCRFAWDLSYQQGWKPKKRKKYFDIGIVIHECLAMYYEGIRLGKDPGELLTEIQTTLNRYAVDGVLKFEYYGVVAPLITRYIRDFAPLADKGWEILGVEKHFSVPLITPKGRDFILEGVIDLLHRINGRLSVTDHKSYNKQPWRAIEILMDPQTPTYVAGVQKLIPEEVHYINYNMLNTYEYKDMVNVELNKLFKREQTYRSPKELTVFIENLGHQVDDIIDNKHHIYRHLKKDCGQCQFADPCLLAMKGIPISTLMEESFVKKN